MSNPERLRILGLLRNKGEQTVGQICSMLDMAPGSVSYHLRRLEKAGLAERSPRPGGDKRQSWWKACDPAVRTPTDPADTSDEAIAIGLKQAIGTSYVNAYTRYLQHLAECPRDWRRHEIGFDTVLEMTPAEMEELEKDLNELITRWTERTSPQSRPSSPNEGRRQVLVTIQGFAWQP